MKWMRTHHPSPRPTIRSRKSDCKMRAVVFPTAGNRRRKREVCVKQKIHGGRHPHGRAGNGGRAENFCGFSFVWGFVIGLALAWSLQPSAWPVPLWETKHPQLIFFLDFEVYGLPSNTVLLFCLFIGHR
jgi:hypothetical protein